MLAVDNASVRLARSHVHTGFAERLPTVSKRSVLPVSGVAAVGQAPSNSEPIRSGRPPAQGHRRVLAVDNASVRLARSHVHTGLTERLLSEFWESRILGSADRSGIHPERAHVANEYCEQEDQRDRRGVQHHVLDGVPGPGPGGDHRVVGRWRGSSRQGPPRRRRGPQGSIPAPAFERPDSSRS